MRSEWFAVGRPAAGGLLIPGYGRAAHLLICPAGITLTARGTGAQLPWIAFERSWSVSYYGSGRGAVYGVAIEVTDESEQATASVRRATGGWWHWFLRMWMGSKAVPLRPMSGSEAERATLSALFQLLRDRPDLRPRLADPARAAKLAADLGAGPVNLRCEPSGTRRVEILVLTALRQLGYRHSHGCRPVAGDELPSLQEILDQVLHRVADNPYVRGDEVTPEKAAEVIRKHYLDVEPWPFAALIAA